MKICLPLPLSDSSDVVWIGGVSQRGLAARTRERNRLGAGWRLSTMPTEPVRVPVPVGVNVTSMLQVAAGARTVLLVQVVVGASAKSPVMDSPN